MLRPNVSDIQQVCCLIHTVDCLGPKELILKKFCSLSQWGKIRHSSVTMREDQTQFLHSEGKSDTVLSQWGKIRHSSVTMRKDHIIYSSITAWKITFPLLWAGPNSYEHLEKVKHSEKRSVRHARSHTVLLWHAKFTFPLLWADQMVMNIGRR